MRCINRDAFDHAVLLSDEMWALIVRAGEFTELSGGAFDITYASVGHLYDYRLGVAPSDAQIEQARAAIGHRHLLLDRKARSLRFARPGMRIDLGGFAKGHAVDRGAAILAARGITNAIVTAGGDSRVLGDRRGRPWSIAIRDPRRAGDVVAVLPLEDTAISTSGDYERFFEKDGVRCHHLIDPATGKSPSSVHSVTILAADGLTTEGLSKSVFVLGVAKGMRLVESLPGVDAVVVDAAGELHFSAGLVSAGPLVGQ
jgi:thiamine biosynthesis lipoprotein